MNYEKNATLNRDLLLAKLKKLKGLWDRDMIPKLHNHEVNPGLDIGSRENYLYFIHTCSLNFQRSSPVTWQSALKTWSDPDTNFVFLPEQVVVKTEEEVREALIKHKLALQPNKHINIWRTISHTFYNNFDGDPRKLFEKADYNAVKVLNLLQKEMKRDFPYLSGPKLSNYVLFILLQFSDLKLSDTKSISIIPDTHIMKSSVKLGIVDEKDMQPDKVAQAWDNLLSETPYSPIDFHSILWNWSRNNFQPEVK